MSEATGGRVEAIWLKTARRGPMQRVAEGRLLAGRGLEGNVHQGGRRQVTIIERRAWERATAELGVPVEPSARRANVLVSGVELASSAGRVLRLGACRVRIGGETRPCDRMDEASPGLQAALRPEWRAGVYGVVLDGGPLVAGDPVAWEGGEAEGGRPGRTA